MSTKPKQAVKFTTNNLTGTTAQYNSVQFPASNNLQASVSHSNWHIIGYRTVRGYVREDLSTELIGRLKLKYVINKGWVYTYNNAEIIFIFNKFHKTTCIQFSIPKLLHGDGFRIGNLEDAEKAVEIVSSLINRDFSLFNTSRLDLTSNFRSLGRIEAYKDILHRPSGFSGYYMHNNTLVIHNHKNLDKSGRSLIFYKRNNILRVEARFASGTSINVKELIRKHLNHSSQISEILKESFYSNSVHYFYDLVSNAINQNGLNDGTKVEATFKNLWENYDNTY